MSKRNYGVENLFMAPTGIGSYNNDTMEIEVDENKDFIEGVMSGLTSINNLTEEEFELMRQGKKLEVDESLAEDMSDNERESIFVNNFIENTDLGILRDINEGEYEDGRRKLRIEANKLRLKEPTRIKDKQSKSAYDMGTILYGLEEENLKGVKLDIYKKFSDAIEYILQALDFMHIEKKLDSYLGISLGLYYIKEYIDKVTDENAKDTEEVLLELFEDVKRYIYSSLEFNNIDPSTVGIPELRKILKATTGVREAQNEGQNYINKLITPMKSLDEIFYKSTIVGIFQTLLELEDLTASDVIPLVDSIRYEEMDTKGGVFKALSDVIEKIEEPTVRKRVGIMTGEYLDNYNWLSAEETVNLVYNIVPLIENNEIEKSLKERGENWQDYIKGYIRCIYHGVNPCMIDTFMVDEKENEPLINPKDIRILQNTTKIFNKMCKASNLDIKEIEMF